MIDYNNELISIFSSHSKCDVGEGGVTGGSSMEQFYLSLPPEAGRGEGGGRGRGDGKAWGILVRSYQKNFCTFTKV